jgi:acyl carrier protein
VLNPNEQKLKQVLSDLFDIPVESVGDHTSPDTVPKWDSVCHLNLVLALEGAFDLSFTEEQSVEILSYPLIKAVLKEHGVQF